jgi:dTDP-4-dehydrorhamnose 3,5-epimerase
VRLHETELPGVHLVEWEPHADPRGTFARTFDARAFAEHGLEPHVEQCAVAVNVRAGTLRGLHWQEAPAAECKLVRCVRGAIWDVAVDLRPDAPTYRRWTAHELRAGEPVGLYLPTGVAHGYLTLADDTEVAYQLSAPYSSDLARGARYDDPAFGIEWPHIDGLAISERDLGFPPFRP